MCLQYNKWMEINELEPLTAATEYYVIVVNDVKTKQLFLYNPVIIEHLNLNGLYKMDPISHCVKLSQWTFVLDTSGILNAVKC